MTKQIEVFFDYICPYCNRGIRQFLEILPKYPETQVIWRPCESHPRPEEYGPFHSDIAIQAMFALEDAGGDLISFHLKVFDAWFTKGERLDDRELLAGLAAQCGGNEQEIYKALTENRYAQKVQEANRYAWEERGLSAVPSYIAKGRRALSRDGQLVPIKEVEQLLNAD